MKKIIFIFTVLVISIASFGQSTGSFNPVFGKQDFKDSLKFSKFLNSVGEDSVLTIDRVTKKLKFVLKGGGSSGGVDSCTSASNGFYYWKSGTPTLVITPNNVYSFILNYDSTYQLIYKNSVLEDSISLGVKSLYPEIGSSITIRGSGDSVFIGDGGSGVGYVPYTGATSSPNLGEFGISEGFSQYDTTATTYTRNTGNIGWNDTDGTLEFNLKGNSVSLQIGQETVLRVVNKTGSNLLESQYLAVYVSGAQGQRVKVNLASANADSMSAKTIGVVTENINVNQEGFITTSGLVREINTTGSLQSETWADGDILYLSPTINGGLTNIKPTAPQHTVLMGYCVYAHAIHGSIFVKVVDGFKLDDLHNVNISTPLNNEALVYETATKLWKNKAPIDATKLNISDTASMLSPYYIDAAYISGGFRLIKGGGGYTDFLFSSIDTSFLHAKGVLSFSVNGTSDSAILYLNDFSRFAVALGSGGGGGYVSGRWSRSAFDSNRYYITGWAGVGDTARSRISLTYNNLGANSGAAHITSDTTGFMLINNTVASAGAQQASPAITLLGNGWKTNATAGSQIIKWRIFNLPVQGTTAPTSLLSFEPNINGAGYSANIFTVSSSGNLSVSGSITSNSSVSGTSFSGTSFSMNAASSVTLPTITTTVTNGFSFLTGTASVGTPVRYSSANVQQGHVYNTTTSLDNFATFKTYVKPVSGTAPTATYVWQGGVNAGGTSTDIMSLTESGSLVLTNTVVLKSYTVATLPTGVAGAMAYVTDATTPTYLGTLTGGGAVVCPVFYNGSAWVSH